MIEFKIQYTYKGEKHNIVGITNSAMNQPVHDDAHRENQLTEVDVYKNRQLPVSQWGLGPSYIHSLYFDNQGATLYFKLTTDDKMEAPRSQDEWGPWPRLLPALGPHTSQPTWSRFPSSRLPPPRGSIPGSHGRQALRCSVTQSCLTLQPHGL